MAEATHLAPFVRVEIDDGIAFLMLDRAATRNALGNADDIDCLVEALNRIQTDPAVRVAVLTGAGPAFCAGGDLRALQQLSQMPPHAVADRYREGIQRIPLAFQQLDVPVIAAVNGSAIGAGCDLACMCDIRIASETALFAESFVKLGIIPGDGGAWLLQRAIGPSRAREMAFTGDTISAQQALAWGLVSRVVPASQLLAVALDLARRIAANSAPALRMTKRLFEQAADLPLTSVLELSANLQALAHGTLEHHVAVAAMLEKMSATPQADGKGVR